MVDFILFSSLFNFGQKVYPKHSSRVCFEVSSRNYRSPPPHFKTMHVYRHPHSLQFLINSLKNSLSTLLYAFAVLRTAPIVSLSPGNYGRVAK